MDVLFFYHSYPEFSHSARVLQIPNQPSKLSSSYHTDELRSDKWIKIWNLVQRGASEAKKFKFLFLGVNDFWNKIQFCRH